MNTYIYALNNALYYSDFDGQLVCGGVCGVAVGLAFDAAVSAIRGSDNPGIVIAGNAAGGAGVAATLPTQNKPRGGIAGGGPSGDKTSLASQINHRLAQSGRYSLSTRNFLTQQILRRIPYLGAGLGLLELIDALIDRFNLTENCN